MLTKLRSFALALFLSSMIGFSAFADDLEIYFGSSDPTDVNVLFIMDTSGSMRSKDGTRDSRLKRVQDALRQVLSNASNINAGLMRFSNVGGPILYPVRPIDETSAELGSTTTVRQNLISAVDGLTAYGTTPIVDTLYEAGLYYAGERVDYGLRRGKSNTSRKVRRQTRVSNRASYVGGDPVRPAGCSDHNLSSNKCINEYIPAGARYISPISNAQCQLNNYVVLLSDGKPVGNSSVGKIQSLIGGNCAGSGSGKCGPEMAAFLSRENGNFVDAPVITHTIGFAASASTNSYLNQLAQAGGGSFYRADDSASLSEVFKTILKNIEDESATFVSAGVAVNQHNKLTHNDQLYFSIFKPSERVRWPGNLKRYRLKNGKIVDANQNPAVDPSTGFFAETSQSFWSSTVDGNDVLLGGALNKLTLNRNMFVFNDSAGNIFVEDNRLIETNRNITAKSLGLEAFSNKDAIRNELLKWIRGVDVLDEDRDGSRTDLNPMMGDPLHSPPVLINYSDSESAIYIATNQGFIHSINPNDGTENWSIIPSDLLGNLYKFYENANSRNHIYGIDGDVVVRKHDDKIWLYFGMRRGGNNYYVLDVTRPQNPKFVYKIDGGKGDFANLGQTWSKPILTKINIGGTVRDVLVFGGGYDPSQDAKLERSPDTVGNSVFIVDADNGDLLWSASDENADVVLDDMKYSIPARIATVDRDFDGFIDHMYVADMGGQLFRFDIYNGKNTNELVKGALLATFGGNDVANNRRFFYAPDVSEVNLNQEMYFAVSIGSGNRAGPLSKNTRDYFMMLKDKGAMQQDSDGHFILPDTPYTVDDLYDATLHELTSTDEGVRSIANMSFASKQGWLLRLGTSGEKVLASPVTLNYQVLFTSYLPASAQDNPCAPALGNSRAYLVNMFNGNSVADLNGNNAEEHEDRYAKLGQAGIAAESTVLIEDTMKPVVCLGTECASAAIIPDEQGNVAACNNPFECLAENIFGRFERVQKETWNTEVENQ